MIDWPSFIFGAAVAAVGAFTTGVLQELGAASFRRVSTSLGAPRDVLLPPGYVPKAFAPENCVWVRELETERKVSEGYSFYPVGKRKAKGFRLDGRTDSARKEFLMVRPGTTPPAPRDR